MAVLALGVLVGTFAYRAMFDRYVFPALPLIVKAGNGFDTLDLKEAKALLDELHA
jgi:lactate dehydrogenase-like 2-hydroxyacid dehydrogenase